MNSELEDFLNEVRLVYHRIVEVAELLHRSGAVTLGMRAVLEYLLKNGPKTVPDIARSPWPMTSGMETRGKGRPIDA